MSSIDNTSHSLGNPPGVMQFGPQDSDGRDMEDVARARLFGADPAGTTAAAGLEPSRRTTALARGTVVGRHVLLDKLGAGGMGIVYAAYDPELDRKVALKLLLPGRSDPDGRVRLLREAQALAKLTHANIVAVHDVGTHDEQVWVAMEFVPGQTLCSWAKERPRRWPELLRVLTDVARGVAAAHAVGLVHRDLKPENVMLGRDGRVRVMDFGLAHGRSLAAVEQDLAASVTATGLVSPEQGLAQTIPADLKLQPEYAALAVRLTQAGSIQGTPAYMAPEQWRGDEATTAADQFGWSVMAWELLYGERPYHGENVVALAANVLSGRRRPPRKGRGVPGWLRRLVERGLSPAAAQRWPSMDILLAELVRGRTLARLRVAAVGIVGVAAVAAGWAGYQALDRDRRIDACTVEGDSIAETWNEQARTQMSRAIAATGVRYADGVAEKVVPWFERQSESWRHARTEACLNAKVRGLWTDDILDRSLWCLEDRRMEMESLLASFARADAKVVQKAISAAASFGSVAPCLRSDFLNDQSFPPSDQREAARVIRGELARAKSLEQSGKLDESLAAAGDALRLAKELGWTPLVAAAGARQGHVLLNKGSFKEAEEVSADAYFQAVRVGSWEVAVDASLNLIYSMGRQSRLAEGITWGRHAEAAIAYAGDYTGLDEALRRRHLSLVHNSSGDYETTLAMYDRVLTIQEDVLGPEHPELALSLTNLATVHYWKGEYLKGIGFSRRALEVQERALGPDHPDYALSLVGLGIAHFSMGKYAEARDLLERARGVQERAMGPESPDLASTLNNLAAAHMELGDYTTAQPLFERAVKLKEKLLGESHPLVASSLTSLGAVHYLKKEYESARTLHERAMAIQAQALGEKHPLYAFSMANLARVHLDTGDPRGALALLERTVEIYDEHEGLQQEELEARFLLARTLVLTGGDRARARAEAAQARDGFRTIGDGKAKELGEVEDWLVRLGGAPVRE